MKLFITKLLLLFTVISFSQTLDTSYATTPGFSFGTNIALIDSSVLQPDGKILATGLLYKYNGVTVGNLVRINANGTIDTNFQSNLGTGFDRRTCDVALQNDGKILVSVWAGLPTTFNGVPSKKLIRLNSDGTIDNSFNVSSLTTSSTNYQRILVLPDGKIIVNYPNNKISRLNSDGTTDSTFAPKTFSFGTSDAEISNIKLDSNNKIVITGLFTSYQSTPANGVIRLNYDGSIDNSFNNGGSGLIIGGSGHILRHCSLHIQSDNKIILAGYLQTYNGIAIPNVIRLNNDGSLDSTFNFVNQSNYDIVCLEGLSNGKFYIGGRWNNGATSATFIKRINNDGTYDTTLDIPTTLFNYNNGNGLFNIRVQPDGNIITLGDFNAGTTSMSRKDILRIIDNSLTTNEFIKGKEIIPFPNPVQDYLTFKADEIILKVEVFDISGRILSSNSVNENKVNLTELKTGNYILKVYTENGIMNTKIIKE